MPSNPHDAVPAFTFADNLRPFCALRGISHRDVATALGVPESTVSRWVQGVHARPHRRHVAELAAAYGVPEEGFASAEHGFAFVLAMAVEAAGPAASGIVAGRAPDVSAVLSRWREIRTAQEGGL